MASEKKEKFVPKRAGVVDAWIDEDQLMLLECWARDGYTYQDIANRIGITTRTLADWRINFPEIERALKNGREIVDYKVENALLKSALGYKTKEVKVTTTIRRGVVVEETKEVVDKEQAPNVSAIQCWLYNRLPNKWKRNRDSIIDLSEEDSTIQVTVTRASKKEEQEDDKEWQDEVNQSISVRGKTKQEIENDKKEKAKKEKKKKESEVDKYGRPQVRPQTIVEDEQNDLDYWPDDWEDEDEEE